MTTFKKYMMLRCLFQVKQLEWMLDAARNTIKTWEETEEIKTARHVRNIEDVYRELEPMIERKQARRDWNYGASDVPHNS
jgi:hypothetical protein